MLLLITGASGVGKSTVRELIAPNLTPLVESVELAHLSPVPAVPTKVWRQQATETAVRRAIELEASGRHLLLSGDPVTAAELAAAPSTPALETTAVCLLDVSAQAQATRLAARGDDPSLLPHHQAFAEWMRRQAQDPLHMTHVLSDGGWEQMRWDRLGALASQWKTHVIDTTEMTRREVADAIFAWCRSVLASG